MKRRSIVCLAFLLEIMLCGCRTQLEKVSEMEEQTLQSSINKDNCYICGTPAGGLLEYYYKFDSVGIIHWADMSVIDTHLWEYDNESGKHLNVADTAFGKGYGSVCVTSQPDRGIAEAEIALREKDVMDYCSLKDKLCQDCLAKIYGFYEDQINSGNDEYLESTGYSLIDFTTGELYTLSDPRRGYSIRDYIVRYEFEEKGGKRIKLLICYAPVRKG